MRSLVSCVVMAVAAGAQEVEINGVVKTTAGTPVVGAVVELRRLPLRDTTGSDGSYSIVQHSPSSVAGRAGAEGLRLEGDGLAFTLAAPGRVSLEVRDVRGTLLQKTERGEVASGRVRLSLAEAFERADFLIARLSTGTMETTFRALSTGRGVGMPRGGTGATGALRTMAVADTLRVAASGFVARSVPVESYAATVDVVLQPGAGCNPADKAADPTAVNAAMGGSPLTGAHQVAIETDATLPGRTIYRPKDLGAGNAYPILVWGNGACAKNGTETADFYAEIASHGYVLINEGAPGGTGGYDMGAGLSVLGGYLVKNFEWAVQQNENPCSRFYQSLDTAKIGAFGWSCGGLMAYGASLDPRVDATIIMNSGLLSPDQAVLDRIHAPIAYICGGSEDIAYANGKRDYGNMKVQPTIFGNVAVGHGGTYWADNGGEYAKLAVAWFNWWLKEDKGATGRARFTDANCAFCKSPWTMETKRLP